MTHTRPARRPLHRVPPPTHGRPATASTGPGTWSLPGPRRTSRRPALRRHPPPLVSDAHRLADTLAQALPPLSNRTLSSLLRRLDGDHAIAAAARTALRVLHGRPDDRARAAPERRHHDRAVRAAIAEQQAGGVPLTEAEQRRTFARVVLAALPPLVERTRTLCRQALGRDRADNGNRRVIFGHAPPGPTPPRPAQGTADAQDPAHRDIHRGGHNY